jgi:phosphoribosylcarboxyaminoimidazole (NCAIR) mutase
VSTLLSRKLPAGEQNATFTIGESLNSGLYFIRFIAGNETVIKRISIQ